MGKTVRKLKPGGYWNIEEYESWFSDMARQGLFLKKVGRIFARFTKSEPQTMRYRIKIGRFNENRDMVSHDGWEYVMTYVSQEAPFHVFCSPVELNAPELVGSHEMSADLKRNQKSVIIQSVIYSVIMFLLIAITIYCQVVSRSTPFLNLLSLDVEYGILLIFILTVNCIVYIKRECAVYRLQKSLSQGIPLNHEAPWKNKRNAVAALFICFDLLFLLSLVGLFNYGNFYAHHTLPKETGGLPIVWLADIEQTSNIARDSRSVDNNHVNTDNYYQHQWSLLAPVQYTAEESGTVQGAQNKTGRYSSVSCEVYKTTVPFLNKSILADLMKKHDQQERSHLTEMQSPDFDELYVEKKTNSCDVFAVKGSGIVYVEYIGDADENAVVDAAAKTLDRIAG